MAQPIKHKDRIALEAARVCIVWNDDWVNAGMMMNTLVYHGGTIRTYAPDALDPRIGLPATCIDLEGLSKALMRGERCAVRVADAMKWFGWRREDFALDND